MLPDDKKQLISTIYIYATGVPSESAILDTDELEGDLGIDEDSRGELADELEEVFSIDISYEEGDKWKTVKDVMDSIDKIMAEA